MATKEMVKAEIDKVSEKHLDELLELIKGFEEKKSDGEKRSLMKR